MRVVNSPQALIHFGVAYCDITPPVGIYHRMWGAAIHDRATGIHRPLRATAMVFGSESLSERRPPEDLTVLVAIDHCLLWKDEIEDLHAGISKSCGGNLPRLYVTCSHTHGAGLMERDRSSLPGGELIGPYLDEVAIRIGTLVQEAVETAGSAWVRFGQGNCKLAAHRDYFDEELRQQVCGFNPEGPADDSLLVARVTAADSGKTLAIIVNYACHPTSLAWENTLISPDYPGAMREVVEASTGAVCVFIQGASGELGPRDGYSGEVEVADRNGRQLGYAVLSTLESLPPAGTEFQYAGPVSSGFTLGSWKHVKLSNDSMAACRNWRYKSWNIDLPTRQDLPTAEETRAELQQWQTKERKARDRGDAIELRECRAQVERRVRWLGKLAFTSPEGFLTLPLCLWQTGGACWVMLEAEYYSLIQRELRSRHPKLAIVISTLTNGSRPGYLFPKDVYGRGIPQEQASLLAPGAFERVLEEVDQVISEWELAGLAETSGGQAGE